jgi:hypothetical protein
MSLEFPSEKIKTYKSSATVPSNTQEIASVFYAKNKKNADDDNAPIGFLKLKELWNDYLATLPEALKNEAQIMTQDIINMPTAFDIKTRYDRISLITDTDIICVFYEGVKERIAADPNNHTIKSVNQLKKLWASYVGQLPTKELKERAEKLRPKNDFLIRLLEQPRDIKKQLNINSSAAEILNDFYHDEQVTIKNLAYRYLPVDAKLYAQELNKLFIAFLRHHSLRSLLEFAGDTEESKKARVLRNCITQPPILITIPCSQSKLFFAGIQTQLPVYTGPVTTDTSLNDRTNDPRLLESAGILPLGNNELLLYPSPYNPKNVAKFDAEMRSESTRKEPAWDEISNKFTALCSIPINQFSTEHYTAVLWSITALVEYEITNFYTQKPGIQLNFTEISSIVATLVMKLTEKFNTDETLVDNGIYKFIATLPGRLVDNTILPEAVGSRDVIQNFCDAMRNNICLLITSPLNVKDKPYGGIFSGSSPQTIFKAAFEIGNQFTPLDTTITSSSSGDVSGDKVAVSGERYVIPETCFSISVKKHDAEFFSEFLEKNANYLGSIKCIPAIREFILQKLWDEFTSDNRCRLSESQRQRIRDDISADYLDHCSKALFERKDILLQDPKFLARCSSKATIDNKPYQAILDEELKKELKTTLAAKDESRPGFNSHTKTSIQTVINKMQPWEDSVAVQALIKKEILESAKNKVFKNRDYFTYNTKFRAITSSIEKINLLTLENCIEILDDKKAETTTKLIKKNLPAIAILKLYGKQMPNEVRKKVANLNLDHVIQASQFLDGQMSYDRQKTIADTINAYYAANEKILRNPGSGVFWDDPEKQAELNARRIDFSRKIILRLLRRENDPKNISRVFNDNQETGSVLMPNKLIRLLNTIDDRLQKSTSTEVEILKLVKESIEVIIADFESIFPDPQAGFNDLVPQFADMNVHQMLAQVLPSLTQGLYTNDHSFSGEVKTFVSTTLGKFFGALSLESKEFKGDFYAKAREYLNRIFEPIETEDPDLNSAELTSMYITLGIISADNREAILRPAEEKSLVQLEAVLSIPLYDKEKNEDAGKILMRKEAVALTLSQQYGKINDDHWVDFVIKNQFYYYPKVLYCLKKLSEKDNSKAAQRAIDIVAVVKTYKAAVGNHNATLVKLAKETEKSTTPEDPTSSVDQENYTENFLSALDREKLPTTFLTEKRIIDFIESHVPRENFGGKVAVEALLNNSTISLTSKLSRLGALGQGKENGKHRNRSDKVSQFYSAIQIFLDPTDKEKIPNKITQFVFAIKEEDFVKEISLSGRPILNLEHFIQEQILISSERSFFAADLVASKEVENTLENVFVWLKGWKNFSTINSNVIMKNEAKFNLQLKRRINYCTINKMSIEKDFFSSMTARPATDLPDSAAAIVNYMQQLLAFYLQNPNNAAFEKVALVKAVGSFLAEKDQKKLELIESYATVIATTASLNAPSEQEENLDEGLLIQIAAAKTIRDDQDTIKGPSEPAETFLVKNLWISLMADDTSPTILDIRDHIFIRLSQSINKALPNINNFLLAHPYKESNTLNPNKAFVQRYLESLENPNNSIENIYHNFLLRQTKEAILVAYDIDLKNIDLSKISYAIHDEDLLHIAFNHYVISQPLLTNIQVDFIVNYVGCDQQSRLVASFLQRHGKDASQVLRLREKLSEKLNSEKLNPADPILMTLDQHIVTTFPLKNLIQHIVTQENPSVLISFFLEKYSNNLTAIFSLKNAFTTNSKDTNAALEQISAYLDNAIRSQLNSLAASLQQSTKTFSKFFTPSALPTGLQSIVNLIQDGSSEKPIVDVLHGIKKIAQQRMDGASFVAQSTRSKATSEAYKKINEFLSSIENINLDENKDEINFNHLETALKKIKPR